MQLRPIKDSSFKYQFLVWNWLIFFLNNSRTTKVPVLCSHSVDECECACTSQSTNQSIWILVHSHSPAYWTHLFPVNLHVHLWIYITSFSTFNTKVLPAHCTFLSIVLMCVSPDLWLFFFPSFWFSCTAQFACYYLNFKNLFSNCTIIIQSYVLRIHFILWNTFHDHPSKFHYL